MESLESLKQRKKDLEYELERITIKKSGTTPWANGIQDQYESNSYSYNEYTDVSKAYKLIDEIKDLDRQIKTYGQRVKEQQEREEALREASIQKYEYEIAGEKKITENPALAARYNAQHRLFGMNKLQKTLASLSGQRKKFRKLWYKADTMNKKSQEEIANKLNKMFR